MTKESLILYWLSVRNLRWAVQYIDDVIVYTIEGGLVIEYWFNKHYDDECTVMQDGRVVLFGTVEYCLKQTKKPS